jgi:TetR/AcrR family transcriptional regulator, mexJK operon transcriptional repressor
VKKVFESTLPRRGGRPSRQEAGQIRDRVLDAAADLFFTDGYGATSVEAIAARARISKRTFYHRFKDKADVFGAVIHRVIEHLTPPDTASLFEGDNCEAILQRLAVALLRAALKPEAVSLNRLILAEAGRFPELAMLANEQGARRDTVKRIAGLLQRGVQSGRLSVDKPLFAAEQFLHMVISVPQRRAFGLGSPLTLRETDQWARDTVDLFLNGCRLKR